MVGLELEAKDLLGAFPTTECRPPLGSGTHSFLNLAIHVSNTRWQQPHEISASQELQGSRPPGRGVQVALPEQVSVITLSCGRASPHCLSCWRWERKRLQINSSHDPRSPNAFGPGSERYNAEAVR